MSDRAAATGPLTRLLSLWGSCAVCSIDDAVGLPRQPRRIIVVDVDLSTRGGVEAIRRALASCRAPGTPCLFLLRELSPHAKMQANALGATAVLAADAPGPVLLDGIRRIVVGTEADARDMRLQQHFVTASVAIADMLAAAAGGRAPSPAVVDHSVVSINRAADEGEIGSWLELVWRHDDLTYQHCLLVSGLAAAFARQLGFPEASRKLLTAAAVLHDIGKAGIPTAILQKPGRLTADELAIMQTHPRLGHEMLAAQGSFGEEVLAVARSHHEYLDGSGYPDGLKADAIPDVVRLITICDIYAALIERRSYKAPMAPEAAYQTLVGMTGKLDPDLLRAFKAVVLNDAEQQPRQASA